MAWGVRTDLGLNPDENEKLGAWLCRSWEDGLRCSQFDCSEGGTERWRLDCMAALARRSGRATDRVGLSEESAMEEGVYGSE
jgi:hypothetical protein